MSFELPPLGSIGADPITPRTAAPKQTGAEFRLPGAASVKTIPATPPPDLLEQVTTAARVAEELRAMGRELHFEPPTAPGGRVGVQVRDLEGNVIRTVTPAEALEIATGKPV
jgi:flagellar protein FlaG